MGCTVVVQEKDPLVALSALRSWSAGVELQKLLWQTLGLAGHSTAGFLSLQHAPLEADPF